MLTTLKTIAAVAITLALLLGVPAAITWMIADHVKHRGKREPRSAGGSALGGALMELDRLVARPSVEHVVDAENQTVRREDDHGGE
jgi:hypothetical protein